VEANPYSPPSVPTHATGVGSPGEGVFQDGQVLVASRNASFPDRCLKCNAAAEGYRLKRRLTWHGPQWYFLILLNILIYALVASFVQEKMNVLVGLCDVHRRRRTRLLGLGFGIPLLGIAGCSMAMENPNAFGIGTLSVLVGLVLLVVGSQLVKAESIDERFARIRGADPRFLASLPPFHRT